MAAGLEWHVTGLWHPADTDLSDLPYYGMIADPIDGDVGLLLDDSTSAEVTVADTHPIALACYGHAFARCLRGYYHGALVHWGPCKLVAGDLKGTVKLTSVDPSIRLINHFLRRGDLGGALSAANNDEGNVSIDHVGLRLLRDAGLNTSGQTARGVPDLGIIDGTNDVVAAPDSLMGVRRGDQVWNAMTQLSQSLGPDFELQPIEDTVGAYAQLNTYAMQGDDVSADTAFHYGTGRQNLLGLEFVEGSKYITHAHVLSRDLKLRVTAANEAASADTGPYVEWDATDYDETGVEKTAAENVLKAYGEDILKAYGRPLTTVQLTLPPESVIGYRYGTDYKIGDRVGIAGRNGLIDLEQADYRITAIRLKQTGRDGDIQPEIEVIPDRVAAAGDDVTSDEES